MWRMPKRRPDIDKIDIDRNRLSQWTEIFQTKEWIPKLSVNNLNLLNYYISNIVCLIILIIIVHLNLDYLVSFLGVGALSIVFWSFISSYLDFTISSSLLKYIFSISVDKGAISGFCLIISSVFL